MSSSRKKTYDRSERQKIVDFIIEHNLYFDVRGRSMWQRMERSNICPGRTWQSLKEHFHKHIINTLDTLKISQSEKERILNTYHRRHQQKHPRSDDSVSENESPSKRKRFDYTNNNKTFDDERNTQNHIHELNSKKNNVNETTSVDISSKITEEKVPDIIRTTTIVNCEDFNKLQISNQEETQSQEFSEEEDVKIIQYIKNHMNWSDLTFTDCLYEGCEKTLTNRSAASIKDRFLNVILPTLYKYNVLDINDISLFYDRAGVDIPEEFIQILMDEESIDKSVTVVPNKSNSVIVISDSDPSIDNECEIDVINTDSSEKQTEVDGGNISSSETECEEEKELNRKLTKFVIDKVSKQRNEACVFRTEYLSGHLCFHFADGKHIFILDSVTDKDYDSIVKELTDKHSILNNNIHKVTEDKLKDLTKLKTLNDELDNKILEYISTPAEKRKIKFIPYTSTMQSFGVPSLYTCKYKKPETSHLRKEIQPEENQTDVINSNQEFSISENMSPIITSLANRRQMRNNNCSALETNTSTPKLSCLENVGKRNCNTFKNKDDTSIQNKEKTVDQLTNEENTNVCTEEKNNDSFVFDLHTDTEEEDEISKDNNTSLSLQDVMKKNLLLSKKFKNVLQQKNGPNCS